MKNLVIVLITLVVLCGGLYLVIHKDTKEAPQPVGAATGTDSQGCQTLNGVTHCYAAKPFAPGSATTTACSFKMPSTATSTLVFASARVTTATSTAIDLEIGKSTSYAATTTSLGLDNVASGANVTLLASTSPNLTGIDGAQTFAPNTYLNVKWGGAALGPALAGMCYAEWIVN